MARLTREQVLKKHDRKTREIRVPAWDDEGEEATVIIRSLSGKDRAFFMQTAFKDGVPIPDMILPTVLWLGMEEPRFEKADMEILMEKDGKTLDDIADEIFKLSGIDFLGNLPTP